MDTIAMEMKDGKLHTTRPAYGGNARAVNSFATEPAVATVRPKSQDAAEYASLLPRIKQAFVREIVSVAGRLGENTQTAYALALQFDLLPEELRAQAARRLAAEVRTRGHLTTGFVGTPYLCHVLTRYGELDVAYRLLNRQEYPSWLYPVRGIRRSGSADGRNRGASRTRANSSTTTSRLDRLVDVRGRG
jgi:alpha-L-rhamnosidase